MKFYYFKIFLTIKINLMNGKRVPIFNLNEIYYNKLNLWKIFKIYIIIYKMIHQNGMLKISLNF
jgi:hypothetical protein